jgi:hypothetical protein
MEKGLHHTQIAPNQKKAGQSAIRTDAYLVFVSTDLCLNSHSFLQKIFIFYKSSFWFILTLIE